MPDRHRKKAKKPRRKRRLTTVAILPTLVTLGNVVCGVIAVFHTAWGFAYYHQAVLQQNSQVLIDRANGEFSTAAWFILLAMIFDALDGRIARLTKSASQFGALLDSLCDLVTFGVAPAFLVHSMCLMDRLAFVPERLVTAVCIFFVVCTVVRLARFNIESTSGQKPHYQFAGLPSPAAGGVIAASVIPWTSYKDFAFLETVSGGVLMALPFVMLVLAVLMISRLPYAHVLNQLFRAPRPFVVFVEVILVALLVWLFHEFVIFVAFAGYACSGPALWARNRLRKKASPKEAPEPSGEEPLF
ncbi:MAG: CDP-alcohol phosphatidyltransferase family protein [Planctomycetota bacterium]|jgi:CDP-diacylglycerol--serine O-phosphatidyltransferase